MTANQLILQEERRKFNGRFRKGKAQAHRRDLEQFNADIQKCYYDLMWAILID